MTMNEAASGSDLARSSREHWKVGRLYPALRLADAAVALEPERHDLLLKAAAIRLDLGEYSGAEAYLARALRLCADDRTRELHDKAAAQLRQEAARGTSPGLAGLYLNGAVLLSDGDADGAARAFLELIETDPGYAAGWIGLYLARRDQGDQAGAETVLRDWETAHPKGAGCAQLIRSRPVGAHGLLFDPLDRLPVRPKEEALARTNSSEELKATPDSFLELDPGGQVQQADPFIPLDGDEAISGPIRFALGSRFVLGLTNAALVGRGLVVSQAGELISDQFSWVTAAKYGVSIQRGQASLDPRQYRRETTAPACFEQPAFLLAGPTDTSFGDWMEKFPPKLALAEQAGLDCDLVINRFTPPRFIEMLEALGVARNRLIFHDPRGVSLFSRLYVPSWPTGGLKPPMRDIYQVYQRVARRGSGERRLIYLSRRKVQRRPMLNEDEVCQLFLRRGFEEVSPETLSLEQTLEVFSDPLCVAGPYGSAFSNLVFCAEPPVCLGIVPPYGQNRLESIGVCTAQLGARIALVRGRFVSSSPDAKEDYVDELRTVSEQWEAPLDKVERALDLVLKLVGRA